jgi:F-type H+-transporting ATPase subunit b
MTLTHSPRRVALLLGALLALAPSAVSAAGEEGIAALGLNLPGLISQLVNFLIILVILWLLLWKPLLRMLDERKRRIEEGLLASEQAQQAAAESQEESRRVLDEARAEGREVIARAQETANRLRTEMEQQARTEADQIVQRARNEIERERLHAIQSLRAEFADLTVLAAERVVGQSIDRQAHQRLIDEALVNSSFGRNGDN